MSLPIGTIIAFALDKQSIPSGWLLCDGSPIDSKAHPKLGGVMQNTPNLCGRTLIGAGTTDGTTYPRGNYGGEKTHQLTITEMPSHNHDASASVTSDFYFGTDDDCGDGESGWCIQGPRDVEARHMQSLGLSAEVTINNTGGDHAHNNMQPYYVINYIIYAGERK